MYIYIYHEAILGRSPRSHVVSCVALTERGGMQANDGRKFARMEGEGGQEDGQEG